MTLVLLFLGGIATGTMGVLFGASAFLAIPLVQGLYPSFSYGEVLSNVRAGSLGRSLMSTSSTRKHIDYKAALKILIPFSLASLAGLLLTFDFKKDYLLYAILFAILFSELSPYISKYITPKTRFLFSILIGFYQGIISAGSSVLILGLVRTQYPRDDQIVHAKIQALFIEMAGILLLVMVHILHGDLTFPVWLIFAAGSGIGGYLGGYLLTKTEKLSKKTQRYYILAVYLLSIIPFLI
jgi:uncharacterized membrane protein YfcA